MILEKKVLPKMKADGSGPKSVVSRSNGSRMSQHNSVENLVPWQTSPPPLDDKRFLPSGSNSGRVRSSPSFVEFLPQTSASDLRGKGQIKARDMAALHHPTSRFKTPTDHPISSLNLKSRRGQGSLLHKEGRKEAQLTRRNMAAPATMLVSAYASKKVNNYERIRGVLGDSDDRSHIPHQGYRISPFPSVKERSALYLAQAAATADHVGGLTEQGGLKEECEICSKPLYAAERMTVQNIPLHHACFSCKHCGRKLSLLNYTTFHGAFYCKVHYKRLAEVQGRSKEDDANIGQKRQQPQIGVLPVPVLESKNRNNQTGKILVRERMQPRLSGLHLQVSLTAPKETTQLSREKASQNQLARTIWLALKDAAKDGTCRKLYRSGTTKKLIQDPILSLHRQNGAGEKPHKALETAQLEKKQRLLPRVTFPKKGKHVSHWVKTVDGSGDLGVVEKRLLFMDESILVARARKQGPSILEKAMMLQHNSLKWKRCVPMVSPLTSIAPKPSSVASTPCHSETHRTENVTHFPPPEVAAADPPSLAKVPFAGKKPPKFSSSKGACDGRNDRQILERTEPLPKARMKLPALAPPDSKDMRKLPATSKSNNLIALVLEEVEELSDVNIKPMEVLNPSQMKPEASAYLSEHKEEKGSKAEDDNAASASCLVSVEQQSEQSWVGQNEFPEEQRQVVYPGSLRTPPENQFYPETYSEEIEKETQPERISDSFETLNCISKKTSQDTKSELRDTTSSIGAEMEGALSVASLQADDFENMHVPPQNNPHDAPLTCNTAMPAYENPESSGSPVKTANTNGESPRKASSENNVHLMPQEDASGRTIPQTATPQVKEPEASNSYEVPNLIESRVTGNVNVDMKPQGDHGSTVQESCSKGTTAYSAKKQPLKKERNPLTHFFAPKTHRSVPKQEPAAGTTKVRKTPSALATLFGYSLDKGKNQKERLEKPFAKPSEEASDKGQKEVVCSSKPETSKKQSASEIVIQTRSSDMGLQDPEGNYGSHSDNGQKDRSPNLDSAKAFDVNALPTKLGAGISCSIEAMSGMDSLEVPRPSILNMETFDNSQNSLPTTQQISKCPVANLVPTNSEIDVSSRGDLYDQCVHNFPELGSLDGQDMEPKSRNVSSLGPSREDKSQLLDWSQQVPDMLLISVGVDKSANMQGRYPQSTPDLDTANVGMKDEPCSGLNLSGNPMQVNSPHQFSESGPFTMIKSDSLYNEDPPTTGNSEVVQHSDPVSCCEISADNSFAPDDHVEQATTDSCPTGGNHSSPWFASHQRIPELLRDATQSVKEESTSAAERPLKDPMLAEESNQTL